MESSSSSSSTPIQWGVREIDMKEKCLESVLKYLENRCLKYYWALLYHNGSVECEILDETVEKLKYYHMFIWYIKQPNTPKKNRISVIFLSCNISEECIQHTVKLYILVFLNPKM